MRIAVFSDIHGNLGGLRAVLAGIQRAGGAEVLVAAGDLLGGGAGTQEVLDLLVEQNVRLLMGNWEQIILQPEQAVPNVVEPFRDFARRSSDWVRRRLTPAGLELLAGLPLTIAFEPAPGQRMLICHAAPADPWARVCSISQPAEVLRQVYGVVDASVVVYGHAHQHHVLWLDSKLLVNVSSVGLRKDSLSAFTIFEYAGHWTVQQYQVPFDDAQESRLAVAQQVPVP